jgi:beta-phosphoglucomutase-like phosphatase (HAD superfamily)
MSTRSPLGGSHPHTTPRQATAPLRRLAAVLVGLAGTLLASMAIGSAAWAEIPADGGSAPIQPPAVAAAGGMPGWQITLIALGAALAAVLLDRARAARSILSPRQGACRPAAKS